MGASSGGPPSSSPLSIAEDALQALRTQMMRQQATVAELTALVQARADDQDVRYRHLAATLRLSDLSTRDGESSEWDRLLGRHVWHHRCYPPRGAHPGGVSQRRLSGDYQDGADAGLQLAWQRLYVV